jgi:hypothetical protein
LERDKFESVLNFIFKFLIVCFSRSGLPVSWFPLVAPEPHSSARPTGQPALSLSLSLSLLPCSTSPPDPEPSPLRLGPAPPSLPCAPGPPPCASSLAPCLQHPTERLTMRFFLERTPAAIVELGPRWPRQPSCCRSSSPSHPDQRHQLPGPKPADHLFAGAPALESLAAAVPSTVWLGRTARLSRPSHQVAILVTTELECRRSPPPQASFTGPRSP